MARVRTNNLNAANGFTFLRVALVPLFAWLLLWRRPALPWLAAIVFFVAAATDSLDGYIARRLDQVTGLGQFLDPLADKLLVGTALVALAFDRRVSWWAVGLILAREFAVSGLRVRLARAGRSLPAAPLGKAKTIVQIAAVVLLAGLQRGSPVGVLVLVAAVILAMLSGAQYFLGHRTVAWR